MGAVIGTLLAEAGTAIGEAIAGAVGAAEAAGSILGAAEAGAEFLELDTLEFGASGISYGSEYAEFVEGVNVESTNFFEEIALGGEDEIFNASELEPLLQNAGEAGDFGILTGESTANTALEPVLSKTAGYGVLGVLVGVGVAGGIYAIVNYALGSGDSSTVPIQDNITSILSDKPTCGPEDILRNVNCRKRLYQRIRKGRKMRVQNRRKRHKSMYDPKKKSSSKSARKQVRNNDSGPSQSSRVGKKTGRVRRKGSK